MRTYTVQVERTVTDIQQAIISVEAESMVEAEHIAKDEALKGGADWGTTTPASNTSAPLVVSVVDEG